MTASSPLRIEPVALEILRYLNAHVSERNELKSIAWWLVEKRIRQVSTEVKRALDELIRARIVLEETRPKGGGKKVRVYYQLNPKKRATVARLLSEASPESLNLSECCADIAEKGRR